MKIYKQQFTETGYFFAPYMPLTTHTFRFGDLKMPSVSTRAIPSRMKFHWSLEAYDENNDLIISHTIIKLQNRPEYPKKRVIIDRDNNETVELLPGQLGINKTFALKELEEFEIKLKDVNKIILTLFEDPYNELEKWTFSDAKFEIFAKSSTGLEGTTFMTWIVKYSGSEFESNIDRETWVPGSVQII